MIQMTDQYTRMAKRQIAVGQMAIDGIPVTQIAAHFGVLRSTIYRDLEAMGILPPPAKRGRPRKQRPGEDEP